MPRPDHPEEPTTREETKSNLEDSDDQIIIFNFTNLSPRYRKIKYHFFICASILEHSYLNLVIWSLSCFFSLAVLFSSEFAYKILDIPLTGCHFCKIWSTSP